MKSSNQVGCFILVLLSCAGILPLSSALCTFAGSPFRSNNERGTVNSPGYPDHYNGNEECDWFLSPPLGTWPELLVIDLLTLDTNVDGIPDSYDMCTKAKNYLDVGNVRGCGKEERICVAFMLSSSRDFDCHNTIGKYFSHCRTVLYGVWPFKLSFRTDQPDNKAGFNLNYTFIECGIDLDSTSTIAAPSSSSTTKSGAVGGSNFTTETIATSQIENNATVDKVTSTTTKSTEAATTTSTSRTIEPLSVTTKVTVKATTTSVEGTPESKSKNANVTLTVVLIILCVVLFIVIVLVIFRRRIRTWLSEKKQAYTNGDVSSAQTYEQPIPSVPPPIPPPYFSTSMKNGNGVPNGGKDPNGNDTLNGTANGAVNGHANGAHTLTNGGPFDNSTYDTIDV